jgi:membrane protein implicated in regulation of membrane protease activity
LADRLRALDEHVVWVDAPKPTFTPGVALLLGLVAVAVYVGWALVWSWPFALLGVCALVATLVAIARFWFAPQPLQRGSDAEGRARIPGGGVGHDVDEVRRARVEAAT